MITLNTTIEELVMIASENNSRGEAGTLFYTFPVDVTSFSFGDESLVDFGYKLVLVTQMYSVYAESEKSKDKDAMKVGLDDIIREFPYTSLNVSKIKNRDGIIEITHL